MPRPKPMQVALPQPHPFVTAFPRAAAVVSFTGAIVNLAAWLVRVVWPWRRELVGADRRMWSMVCPRPVPAGRVGPGRGAWRC